MSTNQDYILDHCSIDYLRLATFDFKLYLDVVAALRKKYVGWRPKRWLQYKCQISQEGIVYGLAEQNGQGHGIFQASGAKSHVLAYWFRELLDDRLHNLYCTRIDFQATKTRHEQLDYLEIHKRLARPKRLILGDDGNTLYIGNRESDSFWRLYDKTDQHTRLEVELKGNQAKRAWTTFTNGTMPTDIFAAYVKKSRVPQFLARYYANIFDVAKLEKLEPLDDLQAKLAWMAQLDGLAYKLANDHDVGKRAQEMFRRWAEYGEN